MKDDNLIESDLEELEDKGIKVTAYTLDKDKYYQAKISHRNKAIFYALLCILAMFLVLCIILGTNLAYLEILDKVL